MNVESFATRSEWVKQKNPSKDGRTIIGLDMGYSAAKCFCEDGYFCVPNFTQPIVADIFGEPKPDDIIYEDYENGKKYYVGRAALESLDSESVADENALLGREHYLSPGFLMVARTALGMALWNRSDTDGSDIFLQTGLPPAFLTEDEEYIRYVFEQNHHFRLTYGSETKEFDFTIAKENVDVMKQPMGTFYSVAFDSNGRMTQTGLSLFKSDTVIFDGGFGTLDKFVLINGGRQSLSDTNPQLGMKRVLEEARNLIKKDTGVNISIPGMQNCLHTGTFTKVDHIKFAVTEYSIKKYLDAANDMVCAEAMDYIKNDVIKSKFLIMSGGLGAAWFDYFQNTIQKGMGGRCRVLKGNYGSGISNVYANARGYYMARLNSGA